jgi:hypothetical protein
MDEVILMPLYKRTAKQAWEDLAKNKFAGWPSRQKGSDRLVPVAKPSFATETILHEADRVFTIGSCFARNIEEALVDLGLNVVTARYSVPESEWEGRGNGILNKYHPFAMLNELTWALTDAKFPYESAFLDLGKDQWIDLHLPGHANPVSKERVIARRQEIRRLYDEIRTCNVVMLTPGLVEAWWDNEAGYYTDRTIPRQVAARYADRFELHVLSYDEVYRAMSEMVRLIRAGCPSGVRIFVTVSPVPLAATFTGKDVLVANTYSKSVLRAALEQLVSEHEAVEYFPSFETITLSDRLEVFGNDFIHVKDTTVRSIIANFVSALGLIKHPVNTAGQGIENPGVSDQAVSTRRSTGSKIRGMIHAVEPARIVGWAFAPDRLDPIEVRLLINGKERGRATASMPRKWLRERNLHPTGNCGFMFKLDDALKIGDEIRVECADTGRDLRNSPMIYGSSRRDGSNARRSAEVA